MRDGQQDKLDQPPRQREVLILTTYQGMTTAKVSELLDMTPSNVYATLHHVRSTLKEKLKSLIDSNPVKPGESSTSKIESQKDVGVDKEIGTRKSDNNA